MSKLGSLILNLYPFAPEICAHVNEIMSPICGAVLFAKYAGVLIMTFAHTGPIAVVGFGVSVGEFVGVSGGGPAGVSVLGGTEVDCGLVVAVGGTVVATTAVAVGGTVLVGGILVLVGFTVLVATILGIQQIGPEAPKVQSPSAFLAYGQADPGATQTAPGFAEHGLSGGGSAAHVHEIERPQPKIAVASQCAGDDEVPQLSPTFPLQPIPQLNPVQSVLPLQSVI